MQEDHSFPDCLLLGPGSENAGSANWSDAANRAENIATARALLNVAPPAADPQQPPDIATDTPRVLPCPSPRCGGRMIVIETFAPGCEPSWRPMPSRIDTS
jgi:hypothetical protein